MKNNKNRISFLNTMSKIIVSFLFLFCILCIEDNKNPAGATDKIEYNSPHGVIRVSCVDSFAYVSTIIYDGSLPENNGVVWDIKDQKGNCKFLMPRIPICSDPCSTDNAICVKDDKCQTYPNNINIGIINVSGINVNGGESFFTMQYIGGKYKPYPDEFPYASPPFNEGNIITFSSNGDSRFPEFSVSAKAISPIKAEIDSIKMIEGQPITLKWTPPDVPGNSTVSILIELYPVTRPIPLGKIECDCEDNGTNVIDFALLEQLRTLDSNAGFFYTTLKRTSVGFNDTSKVELSFEADTDGFITFPGVIPCDGRGNGPCPEGMTCEGHMCR